MTEWKQKRRHLRYYNITANLYDTRYAEEQALKIEAAIESLQRTRHGSILDLGCGTGLLLPRIHRAKEIVCVDISRHMLGRIETSTKRSANLHVVVADADHTPFRHDYFDSVFAITLLQNMPNPSQTLEEMRRVTKPDATMVVTGLKKHLTQRSFLSLLKKAALKPQLVPTNERLKCHIAKCKKAKKHKSCKPDGHHRS